MDTLPIGDGLASAAPLKPRAGAETAGRAGAGTNEWPPLGVGTVRPPGASAGAGVEAGPAVGAAASRPNSARARA